MRRYIFAVAPLLAAGLFFAGAASAQPYHVRGTLTGIDGGMLTVDDGMGGATTIKLNDDARVFTVDNASIGDIAEGQFIGITSIMSGGDRVALEVHIFDEALRGLAEGHYPWDLVADENMMTNANVARLDKIGADRKLTMTYMTGEEGNKTEGTQDITVSPDATVVSFHEVDRGALMAGEKAFIIAIDAEDGSVISPALVVGRNGVEPPM